MFHRTKTKKNPKTKQFQRKWKTGFYENAMTIALNVIDVNNKPDYEHYFLFKFFFCSFIRFILCCVDLSTKMKQKWTKKEKKNSKRKTVTFLNVWTVLTIGWRETLEKIPLNKWKNMHSVENKANDSFNWMKNWNELHIISWMHCITKNTLLLLLSFFCLCLCHFLLFFCYFRNFIFIHNKIPFLHFSAQFHLNCECNVCVYLFLSHIIMC